MSLALTTSEWIDIGVAAGTGLLALATAFMVAATFSMARSSRDQLKELRRSADAAESAVRQGEALQQPKPRVARLQGKELDLGVENGVYVKVENPGPVRTTVVGGRLGSQRTGVDLTVHGDGRVEATGGSTALLVSEIQPEVVGELLQAETIPLTLEHEAPSGNVFVTSLLVKYKSSGRWIVAEGESHKPKRGDARGSW